MHIENNIQASNNILLNSRGIALLEVIAATAILSFVLVGMMIMTQYARVRAEINYHDRYVLLRTDGELQRIKYSHFRLGNFNAINNAVEFNIPQTNRETIGRNIRVTVRFSRDYQNDPAVGLDVGYHSITALAEWNEHAPLFAKRPVIAERRYIQLREDYFEQRLGP